MRILALADCIPFPPIGGGELRTYHLLRAMAARHDVTLVGFTTNDGPTSPSFPVRVIPVPWDWPPLYQEMLFGDTAVSQAAYEQLEYGSDVPWYANWAQSDLMVDTLRRLARETFDLVLIEHSYMAGLLPVLPPGVPRVLDLVDVHARMVQRSLEGSCGDEGERASRDAEKTIRFERWAASQCACCLAVSENEAAAARTLLGIERVAVVANGVDTSFFSGGEHQPVSGYLLFTGTMNYGPNIEAVQYFVSEILPEIQQHTASAQLHVVGTKPTEQVMGLASEGVIIHGQVPDMRPYYRNASVVVVPVLRGGGTRLKILEAAACAKPIVSTSLGAEGLRFANGRDLLIADSAREFADHVVQVARDRALQERLGRSARQASQAYDWESIGSQLCRVVEGLL